MSATTLAFGAAMTLLAAVSFAAVARLYVVRAAAARERAGMLLFALFWAGEAASLMADTVMTLFAVGGAPPVWVVVALMNARIFFPLMGIAAWACYLLLLYQGGTRGFAPTAAAFLLVGVLTTGIAAYYQPTGIVVQDWRGWYAFAIDPTGPPYAFAVAVNFAPAVVMSLLYGRLASQTHEPEQRFRVRVLSATLSAFFLGQMLGLLDFYWGYLGLIESVLALGAGGAAWVAVRPPRWVRTRLAPEPAAPTDPPQTLKSETRVLASVVPRRPGHRPA